MPRRRRLRLHARGAPFNQRGNYSRFLFSSYTARFEAVAASFTASFPPAQIHFTGDYTPISKNCAQQGRSLVLLNNHFVSLGSLNGIQDLTQFNIPERITDISQEYRAAFLLSTSSRDKEI